mmetsp:Transcript_102819/g.204128  ORF Transcript_102819/g.204128 Transcript_102819/m.204128 type:complete len:146 (-) Transcript_102819:54-491(-)
MASADITAARAHELARLAELAGDSELAKLARELAGEEPATSGQASGEADVPTGKLPETFMRLDLDDDDDEGCEEADEEACEHFELGAGDVACTEADGVCTVDLLPATKGSSRTAKRRFRRQRLRQRLRLLEQFPELKQRILEQDW